MLLLGHIGITTGIIRAGEILGSMDRSVDSFEPYPRAQSSRTIYKKYPFRILSSIRNRTGSIDYRLVIPGSLLPDIIDKPLWFFAANDAFTSGRCYGHTFLLNLILSICGLILAKYRKPWLLIIALSSFIHLILDQMWKAPAVLWWPLLGSFQRMETTDWSSYIIHALTSDAGFYVPEIIGLIILSLIGYRLVKRKGVSNFIRTGALA